MLCLRLLADRLTVLSLLTACHCQAASSAKTSASGTNNGKFSLSTGAFSVTDEYTQRLAAEHPNCTFAEDPRLCIYRLDESLARELAKFFGNQSVTELGAGVGRYARAIWALGSVTSYTAYDGMPDVEERSNHWVRHADLASECKPRRSDWVLSLETAEHIPLEFQEAFLRNIDLANRRGVVISWSVWNASTGSSAHGHVNAKQVMEVQDIFKARGYYFDALATRRLRVHSTLAYLAKRLLVFKRERPTSWVGKYVAKILAQQRTDVTPPGSVSVRG